MNTAIRPQPGRMHFHRLPPLPRVLIGVVLAALLLTLGWGKPPSAQAKNGESPVKIELTALTPSSLGPNDTLSVSGTITNVSGTTIGIPQVLLWRSEAPLRTGQDLDAAIASEETSPLGSRVIEVPTAYTSDLGEQFVAGASANFTVSAPVELLGFRESPAAYLVGVQMRGVYEQRNQTVGRARTVMPFGDPDQVRLTTAIQLDSRPSLTTDGFFVDNHLEQELAPGGRLAELLTAASRQDVSVLIDPALLEQVRAMTTDYRVRSDAGIVQGGQQANAIAWLKRYTALTGDRWRLPYAHPDLLALDIHSRPALLRASIAAGKRDEDTRKLPLAVLGDNARADPGYLKLAAAMKPRALFLNDPEAAPVFGRSSLAPGTTLVNYASGYLDGGPRPVPQDTTLQARQRLLSELAILDTEAGRSRVLLVDSLVAARVVSTLDAPWLKRVALDDAIPNRPPPWPKENGSADQPPPRSLSAQQLKAAQKLANTYDIVADLQGDSREVRRLGAASTASAISSWWRGLETESSSYVSAELNGLRKQLNGTSVHLSSNPRVVMAGRDGQFPISVTNDLDVPITVQVVFTADNPQRLRIPKITDVEVDAGESITLNAAPHANSNGTYAVEAQLKTSSGEKIGRADSITVKANNVGKAGWVLVIGAGVILIGGTVLRIRQVRRGESVRGHGAGSAGPGVTGSTTEADE